MTSVGLSPAEQDRFWASVDRSGECWIWTRALNSNGYGSFRVRRDGAYFTLTAQRAAYLTRHSAIPDGMYIDHRCHTRSCVNPDHLRAVTPGQNSQNRSGSYGASGYRGVYAATQEGKWVADVTFKGQRFKKGGFTSREEAADFARRTRLRLYTHSDADRVDPMTPLTRPDQPPTHTTRARASA